MCRAARLLPSPSHSAIARTLRHAPALRPSATRLRLLASAHTRAMGSSWSSQPNPAKPAPLTIQQTAIHSNPVAPFHDPLHLSIHLLRPPVPHPDIGRWQVHLELDVAHLQARYPLLHTPATLNQRVHHLHIPTSAFHTVASATHAHLDAICNLSAIHACLYDRPDGGVPIAHATIVVHFALPSHAAHHGIAAVTRSVYGVVDMSHHTP